MRLPVTKEALVAVLSLAVGIGVVRARLSSLERARPLPRVRPPAGPEEVPTSEISMTHPRFVAGKGTFDGRNAFSAADIWENPPPAPLPLPPELNAEHVVPLVAIGAERVRAPRLLRVFGLPRPVAETPVTATSSTVPEGDRP